MSVVRSVIKRMQYQPVRVAVLTDSSGAHSAATPEMWPARLETVLQQNGVECQVRTFGVNAWTAYRHNTTAVFGAKTTRQALVDWRPNYVILSTGSNDCIGNPDGRNLTQVQADALELVQFIKTILPSCVLYFAKQIVYDDTHFTTANLKNKGVVPNLMTLKSSGIYTDKFCEEMLEDDVGSAMRTQIAALDTFNAYVEGLTEVDASFRLEGYKLARLGLEGPDGYHYPPAAGHQLVAANVIDELVDLSSPLVTNFADQLVAEWWKFSSIYSAFLTTDGVDDWDLSWPAANSSAHIAASLDFKIKPTRWFYQYKFDFEFWPTQVTATNTADGIFNWTIRGAKPEQPVSVSINGGAFSASVRAADAVPVRTDSFGDARDIGVVSVIGLPPATYTLQFMVGDDVSELVTATVS